MEQAKNQKQCPNCGGTMVFHRRDRQMLGPREATLEWDICRRCKHVALADWSMQARSGPDRMAHETVSLASREAQ